MKKIPNSCLKSIVWIFVFILLIGFLPSKSHSQVSHETVKIHNLHPKPIVEASINGKTAYLLLDTGSDIDLLHIRSAKKYKFLVYRRNSGSNEVITTVNGMERNFGFVYDLDMKIGEMPLSGNFISMDIGNIVISVRNKTGITISGIIGSKTMQTHCFVIDYEKEEIKSLNFGGGG